MKKILFLLAPVAVMASVLFSCESRSKVINEVAGSWSTAPMQLSNDADGQTSVIDNLVFMAYNEKSEAAGTLMISSALSVQKAAGASASVAQPFAVSVSATACISGTWRMVDDDEIMIDFDSNSLKVQVDPDMVELLMNPLSGAEQPAIDSLKPQTASFYAMQLKSEMLAHYAAYSRLDDVKVKEKGEVLQIEVNDRDIVLHRQMQ